MNAPGFRNRSDAEPPMPNSHISVAMTPPHPGDFVRTEALGEPGSSIADGARILGVREASLSATVNGDTALSPEMALRIEKAFGLDLDLLPRMQAWHDTCRIRASADEIAGEHHRPGPPRRSGDGRRRIGAGDRADHST